jgi:SAM-dependent methyltransferase
LTRKLDLDDPGTTQARRTIVLSKSFLKRIYLEWYELIRRSLPDVAGPVLEIGSGPGFLSDAIPGLITSEVLPCRNVQLLADARWLPFASGSLRAIVMTNVMHHIPDCRPFLAEVSRCLKGGGSLVAVEPWVSGWSRFVYRRLHHEPFEPDQKGWRFPEAGPLSAANGALPWIVFHRDRQQFEAEFPQLVIRRLDPFLPFAYLLSGGVSLRSLVPGFLFAPWRSFERALERRTHGCDMFVTIVVSRQ